MASYNDVGLTPIMELGRGFAWMLGHESNSLLRAPMLQRHLFLDLVRLQETYGPTGPITHVVPYPYPPYKGHSEVYAYKTRRRNYK